jgi:hypothetical protein
MSDDPSSRGHGRLAHALIGISATFALVVGVFSAYGMASYLRARDVG